MTDLCKAAEIALEALDEKFTSGNSIPVERATITAEEYKALRKASEVALNMLDAYYKANRFVPSDFRIIEGLRQALAQPEQEPVAWVELDGELVWHDINAALGRNLYLKEQL